MAHAVPQQLFAPRYDRTLAGLLAAEAELVRLTALHAAYATQPDVTAIWQGYIDQKQDAVDQQRLTVEGLTRACLDPGHWVPRSRRAIAGDGHA